MVKSTNDGDPEEKQYRGDDDELRQPSDQLPRPTLDLPPAPPPPQISLEKLEAVYSAEFHSNDGTQFNGGITADKQW